MARLYYQGHGSFRITSSEGKVLYADPYLGDGYDKKCDLLIISHEHHDHTKTEIIKFNDGAVTLRAKDFILNGGYKTYSVSGFTVTGVPAENKNHKREECVGFIIEVDGVKIYASGDTSTTKEMKKFKKLNLDYALLCCDGIYNMDTVEASKCAEIIGAKHSIPYHSYPEHLFSEEVASRFNASGKITLRPSEEIQL